MFQVRPEQRPHQEKEDREVLRVGMVARIVVKQDLRLATVRGPVPVPQGRFQEHTTPMEMLSAHHLSAVQVALVPPGLRWEEVVAVGLYWCLPARRLTSAARYKPMVATEAGSATTRVEAVAEGKSGSLLLVYWEMADWKYRVGGTIIRVTM